MTRAVLTLGEGIELPLEAATETFGLLAVRGAGKTNAARVMAEEMFRAGIPFVAVDPVGSWWGLRSSRDGRGPGLPVVIFGGKHGDVPLERGAGQLVADLVVAESLCCVLDVSEFDSEAARKAFLLDFGRRLYQRNEHPLHLFLEEADDYLPQRPMRDEAQLLRAWENIVRRGRARGLGITLITQRSACLNKNVLEQVGSLIAMRTTGPRDRDSIGDWLRYHAQAREAIESLPSLPSGEAWLWSPNFLKRMERVRFRLSETFDSGETPKVGKRARAPATLADVDLASVRTRMAATLERAKAEDPKELQRKLRELEAQLRRPVAAAPAKAERVEVPVLGREVVVPVEAAAANLRAQATSFLEAAAKLERGALALREAADSSDRLGRDLLAGLQRAARGVAAPPATIAPRASLRAPAARAAAAEGRGAAGPEGNGELAPVHHRILSALAELLCLGLKEPARVQVALMSGYGNPRSGGFVKAIGVLSQRGLVRYPDGETAALTDEGTVIAPVVRPPGSVQELQERFLGLLAPVHRRILEPLIRAYPGALDRGEVGCAAGYTNPRSGGFVKALGRLSRLGLVSYPDGATVRATGILFLEGR